MKEANRLATEAATPILAGAPPLPPIPSEDIGGDFDDGGDDFDGGDIPVIARPQRDEWITLRREAAISVRLVKFQHPGRDYRIEYFYVPPVLRREVAGDVKAFTVLPAYSWLRKKVFLYVVPVAEPGASGWGDSMLALLAKPAEWHAAHAARVRSNKDAGRYEIRVKPAPGPVTWPGEDTNSLLATALGESRIITSAAHPMYVRLLEGEDLE